MRLEYAVRMIDGKSLRGSRELKPGENLIRLSLPEGVLERVSGSVELELEEGEKFFLNGYQTWSYCPEYDKNSRMMPWRQLPGFIVRHYGIDRYGDYHFMDYSGKRGVAHGYSYCYFRQGDTYRLLASLDERPGYTVFRYDSRAGLLEIERDSAGLKVEGDFPAFSLYYARGTEQEVFDGWFQALGISPRTENKLAGYSSWYNRYENIDEDSILADLDLTGDRLIDPLNLSCVARTDIDRLVLFIQNVTLCGLQFPQIKAAAGVGTVRQVIRRNIDIALVVRGKLSNGITILVIQQELDTIDALATGIDLVD